MFWKASILQTVEGDIIYVEKSADKNGKQWKNGCDYYLLSYERILSSKFALQNGLEKVLFTATIGCCCVKCERRL